MLDHKTEEPDIGAWTLPYVQTRTAKSVWTLRRERNALLSAEDAVILYVISENWVYFFWLAGLVSFLGF